MFHLMLPLIKRIQEFSTRLVVMEFIPINEADFFLDLAAISTRLRIIKHQFFLSIYREIVNIPDSRHILLFTFFFLVWFLLHTNP